MLASRGCGVLRLECRLACPPQKPLRVGFGLFEPTVAVKHLSELMRLQLERLRLTTPITAIDVEAMVTAPLERRQQELFADDSPRSRPRQLAGLIDRLSTRLGRDAVVRARLKPDAQPELAWQCEPLVDQGSRFRKRSPATPTDWPPRPLQLLPHPLRLSAMSLSPDGTFPAVHPCDFLSTAANTTSRTPGGRSGSKRVGGVGRRSAATISTWRLRRAAASGSFAASATDNGFYTERSIRIGREYSSRSA